MAFAIWFVLSSWAWPYLFNLFFSYPFGLAALGIYFLVKRNDPGNQLNKKVIVLLIIGWICSIAAFLLFQ
jgi:hypothetical protein